jgi:hypothetical protein
MGKIATAPKIFEGVRCIECGRGIVAYYGAATPEGWKARCEAGHVHHEVDLDLKRVHSVVAIGRTGGRKTDREWEPH